MSSNTIARALKWLADSGDTRTVTKDILSAIGFELEVEQVATFFFSGSSEDRLSCVERVVRGDDAFEEAPRTHIEPVPFELSAALFDDRPYLIREGKSQTQFYPIRRQDETVGALSLTLPIKKKLRTDEIVEYTNILSVSSQLTEASGAKFPTVETATISASTVEFSKSLLPLVTEAFGAVSSQLFDYSDEILEGALINGVETRGFLPIAGTGTRSYLLDELPERYISDQFPALRSGAMVRIEVPSSDHNERAGYYCFLLEPNRPLKSLVVFFALKKLTPLGPASAIRDLHLDYIRELSRLNAVVSESLNARSLAIEDRSLRYGIEIARIYKHKAINRASDLNSQLKSVKREISVIRKAIEGRNGKKTSSKNLNQVAEDLRALSDRVEQSFSIVKDLNKELGNITKWRNVSKTVERVGVEEIWRVAIDGLADRINSEEVRVLSKGQASINTIPDYLEHMFLTFLVNSLDAYKRNGIRKKGKFRSITVEFSQVSENSIDVTYADNAGGVDRRKVKRADGVAIDDLEEILEGGVTGEKVGGNRGYGLVVVGSFLADHPSSNVTVENNGGGLQFNISLTGFPSSVQGL